MAHLGFNPSSVEAPTPTGVLPKGRYVVMCEKSEVKLTKKGTGHILLLVFVVTEGEYKKKKIYDYVNIQNENPVAQRIGQQHLAGFCHAVGITQLDNSFQLHGIPVEVEVGVREDKDGYGAKNIIRGFVKKVEQAGGGINLSQSSVPPHSENQVTSNIMPPPSAPRANITDIDDDIPF